MKLTFTFRPARVLACATSVALFVAVCFRPALADDVLPAGPQKYDVELVVFRAPNGSGSPENWAVEQKLAGRGVQQDSDDDAPAAGAPERAVREISVTPLPPERFKLTGIDDTLRRSREYQPLAHFGWTQIGYPMNSAPQIELAPVLPGGSPISGKATLSRGHYLHLTLDLAYQAEGGGQRYFLQQSRRMRSNEKHYFDHPIFGVIAVVTPVQN